MPLADADTLRPSLRGALIEPGQAGYDEARAIWNGMIDRRPSAIARCVGTADIQACVRFARERNAPFTIRGGGHNIAGLAVADDALMIDLSGMRGAWVDHARGTVRGQPGATLGDIDRETQLHGRAAVLGFVANTGATGLTLGGGFGYLTRRFGWTCDNVEEMEVVTADGELVRASASEHDDLFWGLRGGGGNFGVVTGIDHKLYEVGPEIVGGIVAWPLDQADDVLDLYREVADAATPEFSCVLMMRNAPPAPWLDPDIHGRPIIGMVICHSGPVARAEADVAPILDHGSPAGCVVQRRPYVSQQAILDATQPNGRRYYWKSEYVPSLGDGLLDAYRRYGSAVPSPHSAILLFPVGGAIHTLSEDHSPMGNRDARWVLNIAGAWDSPEDDDAQIDWVRDAWSAMRPFSTGGTYVNFLTEDDGQDRIRDAYGAHYDRLVEVKRRWDPDNVFSSNKNISP